MRDVRGIMTEMGSSLHGERLQLADTRNVGAFVRFNATLRLRACQVAPIPRSRRCRL